MSAKTMQTIFGRVAREPEFRRLLMCDRDQAFAGYDLTTIEVTALTKFAAEKLGAATQELAVRTARARSLCGCGGERPGCGGDRPDSSCKG